MRFNNYATKGRKGKKKGRGRKKDWVDKVSRRVVFLCNELAEEGYTPRTQEIAEVIRETLEEDDRREDRSEEEDMARGVKGGGVW